MPSASKSGPSSERLPSLSFSKEIDPSGTISSISDPRPACRVRLRPVMMTTLATIIGLLPMAIKFGEGSESYAPLARALVGGLSVSGLCTIFIVPAAFYLIYGARQQPSTTS